MLPKYSKYQDYVIKDGKLIGEFEEMYKDHEDPWNQTTREAYSSEKAAGINLITRLKNVFNIKNVVELGSGFGDYSARIHQLGLNTTGLDISPTAVKKANERHLYLNNLSNVNISFEVSDFDNFERLLQLCPDIIVMPEITWYVLDKLPNFKAFLKKYLPNTFLLHMLMTYSPGVQVYGREYFSDLEGILEYFGMHYLESGLVNISSGGARTWFLGTWNEKNIEVWSRE
jgi:SAM-dependent methyltransferase